MMSILELTDSLWKWKNIDHLDALRITQRNSNEKLNIEFTYEDLLNSYTYTTQSELEKDYAIKVDGRIINIKRYVTNNSGKIKDLIIDCSCFTNLSLKDILEALIVDYDDIIDSLIILNYNDSIGYLCNAKYINYVNTDLQEFDISLINKEIPAMTINCRNFIGESLESIYDISVLDLNIACSLTKLNTMINAFQGNTVLTKLHNLQFITKGLIDSYDGAFSGCINLVELPIFDASKTDCTFYNAFLGCIKLKTIKGLIGADNSLDFSTCPNLSRMSISCIIKGLGNVDKNKTLFLTSKHHDELPLLELDILFNRHWLLKYPDIIGIQFDGTQYIDTGIIPDLHTSIEVTFKITDESNPILGLRDGNTSEDYKYSLQAIYGEVIEGINNPFRLSVGNLEVDTTTVASLNTKWTIKIDPLSYIINNESYNILPVTSYLTPNTIYLGNINLGDTVYENGFKGIIYSFKVWYNNTLTMNLVPKYNYRRQSVLYDTISKKEFYCHNFLPVTKIKIGDSFAETIVLYGQGKLNLVNEELKITTGSEPEMYVMADDLQSMFYITDKLTYIDFGGVTFNNQLWAYSFSNQNLLEELYGIALPLSGNCDGMFEGCTNLTSLQLLSADKITSTTDMFKDCINLLHWKGINGLRAIDLDLSDCENLTQESLRAIIQNLGVNIILHKIILHSNLLDLIDDYMINTAKSRNWTLVCSILPLNYQKVEYIETKSNAYLNTGTITYDNTYHLEIAPINISNDYKVFGTCNFGAAATGGVWRAVSSKGWQASSVRLVLYLKVLLEVNAGDDHDLYIDGVDTNTALYNSNYNGRLCYVGFMSNDNGWLSTRIYHYYVTKYGTEELVLDMYPCYRKSDGVAGLYDIINDIFYINANGSSANIVYEGSISDLPFEELELPYEQLEYIESTGLEYINTLHIFSTKYLYTIQYENITEDDICIFGARAGASDEYSGNDYFRLLNNLNNHGYTLDSWTRQYSEISPIDNPKVIVEASSKVFNIYNFDNTLLYTVSGNKVNNGLIPIYLFGCNNAGTAVPTKCRIYNFTITNEGEQIMNLIPVKRKEDEVICMFDTVNEEYYENKGTGEFISGGN